MTIKIDKILIIIIEIFFSFGLISLEAQVIQPAGKLDVNTKPTGQVAEIKEPAPEIAGSTYLTDIWLPGEVILLGKEQKLSNQMIRFDLKYNSLEINTELGVKHLPESLVKAFTLYTPNTARQFIHVREIDHELPLPQNFFFEVSGNYPNRLLTRYLLGLRKGYYVVAIDVGSKQDRIIIKESLFIEVNSKIYKLPSKKKDILELFADHKNLIETYIKNNHLKLMKKDDITKVLIYYDSLLKE